MGRARGQGLRGVEIESREAGARFRPGACGSSRQVGALRQAGEKLLDAIVVGVLGKDEGAGDRGDAFASEFVVEILADELVDLGRIAVADEVRAFFEAELGELRWQ